MLNEIPVDNLEARRGYEEILDNAKRNIDGLGGSYEYKPDSNSDYGKDYGYNSDGSYVNTTNTSSSDNKTNDEVVEKVNDILQLDDNLQYDSRVEEMQIRNNELGFRDKNGNPLATDGKFGPKTEEALNKFKETNGLWNYAQYKGKAGKTTLDFMYSDNAKSYKQVQSEIVNSGKVAFKEDQEASLDTIDYNDVSTQGATQGYLDNAGDKELEEEYMSNGQTEDYSIMKILQDGHLEDTEITEAILRMISEDGADSGVLMAFNQVQGTAVLNIALKDGHAVDLNGNTIDIAGLDICRQRLILGLEQQGHMYIIPDMKMLKM